MTGVQLTADPRGGTVAPINLQSYGCKADGAELLDAKMTAGSPILETATVFTQQDVGKMVMVVGAGAALQPSGCKGTTNGTTTITGVTYDGFRPGCGIIGTGIPLGATVVAVSGSTITLSAAATSSEVINLSLPGPLFTTVLSVAAGVPTLATNAAATMPAGAPSTKTTGAELRPGVDSIPVESSSGFQVGSTVVIEDGAKTEKLHVIGTPDATHVDVENGTTQPHATGVTVKQAGTVCIYASDDTATINSIISTASLLYARGAKLFAPRGIYGISGKDVKIASGISLEGESRWNTWFARLTVSTEGQPGTIVVRPTVSNWSIRELEVSGSSWSGGSFITPADSAIMVNGGTIHGRVEGVRAHHSRNSGLAVESNTASFANAGTNVDVMFQDCEAWGCAEDGMELNSGTEGTKDDRIQFINCSSHHNRLNGLEIDGTAAEWAVNETISNFRGYRNGSNGLKIGGAGGATSTTKSMFIGVQVRDNFEDGLALTQCNGLDITGLMATGNLSSGLHLSGASGITGTGLELAGNGVRAVLMDSACKDIDLTLHAHNNGASSSVGQAAVEVTAGGGTSSDITLRGSIRNNTRGGLQMLEVARGRLDVVLTGNGARGAVLKKCTRLGGYVAAYNNTTAGIQLTESCVRCSFLVELGTDNASQGTGWEVVGAGSENNSIGTVGNECATPFTDTGTGTKKPF